MAVNILEGVSDRFERDVDGQSDERKLRNYAEQPEERLHRLYVDPSTGDSEFDGYSFPEED